MFWDNNRVSALIAILNLVFSIGIEKHFSGDGVVKPDIIRKVYIYMPTVVVIGLNLMDYSITDAIKWMYL